MQGLAVFEGPDGAKGGIIEFTTTVEPGTSGKVAVGMLEGEVFGTGSQWRVAGWSSALAAGSLLNLNLADYRISHEVDGRVDGPSVGALMTVATLAAFLGDTVDPKVTMTGTINPDFTVGPVGGIPLKLQAAAKAGKTVMLVPLGQRVQQDPNTGGFVDVIAEGKALGVDVREVGDVYAAYEAFTGQRLPRPMVVDREPKLTAKAHTTVMSQAASWVESCLQQLDEFDALPANVKTEYETGRAKYANQALADADKYTAQGIAGGAYVSAVEAARQAALGLNYSLLERDIQARGEYAAGKALRDADISGALDVLGDELLAAQPAGVGEAASLLEAWGYWTVATRLAGEADSLIETLPKGKEADGRLDSIYTAVWDYTLATVASDSARDALELGQVLKGEPLREPERLTEMAEAYRRAAEANLDTIDVVVIPGSGRGLGRVRGGSAHHVETERRELRRGRRGRVRDGLPTELTGTGTVPRPCRLGRRPGGLRGQLFLTGRALLVRRGVRRQRRHHRLREREGVGQRPRVRQGTRPHDDLAGRQGPGRRRPSHDLLSGG